MQWRSGQQLREQFLTYFEGKGCRRYSSFPLVPDDPTLLFTVAGMVPFKSYFLGLKTPEVRRATTAQKCIRTNDIDNVGKTARHHTFFEMLGNFSFGDYFKKEMIPWAWAFLTEELGLDPNRMYASVYLDDDEAAHIWGKTVGLAPDRIIRLGDEDNFWAAGPVGPCGPCSEILYDQGPAFSCNKPTCAPGCDCDRYLEIWNLVFMQFNRDENGVLSPLPHKNIDTGMGLERLSSVVQQVKGDFETDLFRPLIDLGCSLSGVEYGKNPKGDLAVRVMADHLRAAAFMIADGVLPTNDGAGYVLRRIIRRSIRYGRMIGIDRPFVLDFMPTVCQLMADPYAELVEQRSTIEQVLTAEETRFTRTLEQGNHLLESEIKQVLSSNKAILSGDIAFELYDTYGFPLELTEEICVDSGLNVDSAGFNDAMSRQKERARASSKQVGAVIAKNVYTELFDRLGATEFLGYTSLDSISEVKALVCEGELIALATEGQKLDVVLDKTAFYAERGGQVGDTGAISIDDNEFIVEETLYPSGDLVVHRGHLNKGQLKVGDTVLAKVEAERRLAICRHHTATHLLHEALGRVLGKHVRQAGSLVTPTFLRFDYNHFNAITSEEIGEIERIINQQVLANYPVQTHVTGFAEARALGAKALFEEKYGDVVRVLKIGEYSTELCGGTHVGATGEIGLVKIVRDEGIGSGMRRINAVVGMVALGVFQQATRTLYTLSNLIGSDTEGLLSRVEDILDEKKILENKNQDLLLKSILANIGERVEKKAHLCGETTVIVERFNNVPRDVLRQVGDRIRQLRPDSMSLLASVEGDQVSLIGMASDSAVKQGAHAGNLVKAVATAIGGSGGGKPSMGQAGSKTSEGLDEALQKAIKIAQEQLKR